MLNHLSPDPIALHARLRPEALACVDLTSQRQWSYRAFDRSINQLAGALRAIGIEAGDRVAVHGKNTAWQTILQQALMRLGALHVPLNWRLSLNELALLIEDCAPKLIFGDDPLPPLPDGVKLMSLRGMAALADQREALDLPPFDGSKPCVILYTSGTSGRPKGALISANNMIATAINFGILGEVDERSIFLCDSPMFHVIGMITQIWPALFRGGRVLISEGFTPALTNARLADPQLGVTHYFCVTQMADSLRQLPDFDVKHWASLKAIFTGGAPNPAENIRWWLGKGMPMVDGYGMTEAGTLLGMPLDPKVIDAKAGSVGLSGPLCRIRLVDSAGCDVPDDTAGEIVIAGMNVVSGYWNRDASGDFFDGAWMRTGDIAIRDRDGYFRIIDRRKDMFISGGENVYPAEVEAILREHPEVLEAAVIGVPDPRWGEVGQAFVVCRSQIAADALLAHCDGKIARYKIPKFVTQMDSLPRTGSGKVLKHVLREQMRAVIPA